MKIKQLYISVIVLMTTMLGILDQVQSQCLDPIRDHLKKSMQRSNPSDDKVYFLEFTTHTIPAKASKVPQSSVVSKIYRQKEKMIYDTKDITIYQDASDAFMVVHPLKRVVWEKLPEGKQKNEQLDLTALQLAIIDESTVISCKQFKSNGLKVLRVKLRSNERLQDELKLDVSIIDFDLTNNQFIKVESIFSPGHQLERQIVEYKTLNYNYRGREILTARHSVMDNTNKLLPAFRNYTLVEN